MRWLTMLTMIFAVGCTAEGEIEADGLDAMSDDGLYHVEFFPTPSTVTVDGETTFMVHVMEVATDIMIPTGTVTVDPQMPSMGHGIDGPYDAMAMEMDGMFEVAFQFTMPGTWNLHAHIDADAGVDDATVAIEVQ
jgi:hypothetical protein